MYLVLWQYECSLYDNYDKFHSKTKHLEVDHHFIRERVANGEITTKYVPSKKQLADIFIKPLSKDDFYKLRDRLGMWKLEL